MTNPQAENNWEKEFDDHFFDYGYHERNGIEVLATGRHICGASCRPRVFRNFSRKNVKDFIRSLLSEQTKRARLDSARQAREDLLKHIETIGTHTPTGWLILLESQLEALKKSLEKEERV